MRRALLIVLALVGLGATLAFASYGQAREAAAELVGPLPREVVSFRPTPIPFRRAPVTERWGWVIAYGPRHTPGHVGFAVFVAPFGEVVGVNPTDLPERLRALDRR